MKIFILVLVIAAFQIWIQIEQQNLEVVKTVIRCAETEEFDENAYKICEHFAVKSGIFNEIQ